VTELSDATLIRCAQLFWVVACIATIFFNARNFIPFSSVVTIGVAQNLGIAPELRFVMFAVSINTLTTLKMPDVLVPSGMAHVVLRAISWKLTVMNLALIGVNLHIAMRVGLLHHLAILLYVLGTLGNV
jgi:hypothetical protein